MNVTYNMVYNTQDKMTDMYWLAKNTIALWIYSFTQIYVQKFHKF